VAGSEAAVAVAGSAEEVRAVTGRGVIVSRRGRKLIDEAVQEAEAVTGLQFCVYLGPVDEDSRAQAEKMFVDAGLVQRPAVLVLVAPDQHKIEIVTAPDAKERLTDEECALALQEMTPYFVRNEFVEGLVVGLHELSERTGPGKGDPGATDLPNLLG
jgi:uncharacterized membrane protein YgcG